MGTAPPRGSRRRDGGSLARCLVGRGIPDVTKRHMQLNINGKRKHYYWISIIGPSQGNSKSTHIGDSFF